MGSKHLKEKDKKSQKLNRWEGGGLATFNGSLCDIELHHAAVVFLDFIPLLPS